MKRSRSAFHPGVNFEENERKPKRRKLEKSSKSFIDSSSQLFTGTKVLIIPQGIGPVRYGILKNCLKKRGAKIHHRLHSSTTHIISTLSQLKILSILGVSKLSSNIVINSPDWITECLKKDKLLSSSSLNIDVQSSEKVPKPKPVLKSKSVNYIDLQSPVKTFVKDKSFDMEMGIDSFKDFETSPSPIPFSPISKNSKIQSSPIAFKVDYSSIVSPSPLKAKECKLNDSGLLDKSNHSFKLEFDSEEEDSLVSIPESKWSDKEDYSISDDEWLSELPSSQPTDKPSSSSLIDKKQSKFNTKHLVCQKPTLPNSSPKSIFVEENLNKKITDILEQMEVLEKNLGEQWRALAYRKAVTAIKSLTYEIKTIEEAKKVNGIGDKISNKIVEILETGTLHRIQYPDERTKSFQLLSKVWGAGPESVKKFLAKGYSTIDDLRNNMDILTKQQQIGVKYYEEFQTRIPRDEVTQLYNKFCSIVSNVEKNLIIEICGSYRRGALDCGDIDILITHKTKKNLEGILQNIVKKLHEEEFLTEDLSFGSSSDKYMGVCCISRPFGSGIHRRIDIQTIQLEQWPLAILYFTGSSHFNRSMRLWARKNGFSLSEKTLQKRFFMSRRYSGSKEDDILGECIPIKTEKDVFEALGLSYIPPNQRNV